MVSDMNIVNGRDVAGDGFQFFNFRNIIAFFTIFGWSWLICLDNGYSNMRTIISSSVAGLETMILISFVFYWISKLAESGTLRTENAVGIVGVIYVSIAANGSKTGKAPLKTQGILQELEAITDTDLETVSLIKVIALIIKPINLKQKQK